MMGLKTLLLVSLLTALGQRSAVGTSATSGHDGGSMPGSPRNISSNDPGLQEVVLTAAYSFNNQSNDAFLFKPSAILRAQRQVVKGVRYVVDLEISRTVCRKRGNNNNNNLSRCDFQPEGPLNQTFQCHFDLWVIPWQHKTESLDLFCKS